MEFKASALIDAPASAVWSILIDTDKWPEWDPSCDKIEGTVELGKKVKAFTKLSPGRAFAVKVTTLDENRQMVWSGGMPLGLFKGVRTFSLNETDDGVEFVVHEVFSGPMLGLIGKSIPDMSEAFEGFVGGLKARAEASRPS